MPKSQTLARTVIPEHLMLMRLAQSEQMREFFIQVWIQNPKLAKQGGIKVQNLMSSLVVNNAAISPNFPARFSVDSDEDEKLKSSAP